MKYIDMEKLKESSSDDDDMKLTLLTMGIDRIKKSEKEIDDALSNENWEELSRIIHKLRPILVYTGLTSLNDDLLAIEMDCKEEKNLSELPDKFKKIIAIFQEASLELQQIMDDLGTG